MKPWNRNLHVPIPMSAAAVCLLLAACGGGSSDHTSEKAVSSSPGAPGSAISTAGVDTPPPAAQTDGPAGGATNQRGTAESQPGSTAGDGRTGPNPGSEAPASSDTPSVSPATSAQTITDQGIRGDVLRSMLDQKLNEVGPRDTPSATPADGRHGWFKSGTGIPRITNSVRLVPDNYVDESNPRIPWPILRYSPLNGQSDYLLNSYIQSRWGVNSDTTVPVRPFSLKVGIEADRAQMTLGQTLTLDVHSPAATWKDRSDQPAETLTLKADSSPSIRRDALVSFGQVIQRWQGAPDQKVELVLAGRCDLVRVNDAGQIFGEAPDRTPGAELCWRIDTPKLKREVCTMYEVPIATMAPDAEPKALAQAGVEEMADDRSTFPGESGSIFWRQGYRRCEGKGGLQ